jgi:tetratricopeptide (TPR) repeat protein
VLEQNTSSGTRAAAGETLSRRRPRVARARETCYFRRMRGALPTGLLLVFLSSLGTGCWEEPPAPKTAARGAKAERPGGVPSWVPAATPEQEALLAPLERAIKAPARRVFPDLERFGYANNRPLADVQDAVKFTRLVNKVLDESAQFYALDALTPGAANGVAQYGPAPAAADGYKVARRHEEGLELVAAAGAEEARAAVALGAELLQAGNVEGALDAYRAGLTRAPAVPALRLALGAALVRAGHAADAELAYREILAIDPTFAPAHLALAELADKRGDRQGARRAVVEALAYHPASPRGLALLHKLVGGAPGRGAGGDGGWYDPPPVAAPSPAPGRDGDVEAARGDPFTIFLDVDGAGAIHVATAGGDPGRMYGGCRAVMRYEPAVRAQIFQQPREASYYLTVAEEVICLEAALGAYVGSKHEKNDPELERLLGIAREDGLSGYVMFEILGQHRPERARAAPADVHRDTVSYLERWVLVRREPAPPAGEGVFTAKR